MKLYSMLLLMMSLSISELSLAKKTTVRKTQEVDFSEMSLKGTVRNPEGAFLVQKRGIKFMPLYEIQKDLDQKIRESNEYTR